MTRSGLRLQNELLALLRGPKGATLALVAFVFAIYFLHGALALVLVVASFLIACATIAFDWRSGTLREVRISWPAAILLIALSVRLAIPPYGETGTLPGSAVTRALLIAGLYALAFASYTHIRFDRILWLLAAAAFSATVVAGIWYAHGHDAGGRISFIGRSSNSILGAGGIVAGLAASVALLTYESGAKKWLQPVLLLMILVELVAVYLSGSRGPMIALLLALLASPFLVRRAHWQTLYAVGLLAGAVVTSSVLLEGPIKDWLCPMTSLACRPSYRQDVWLASLGLIGEHPILGVGYSFRFPGVPHAHNAYLGMALHYGVPLLVMFLVLLAAYARDTMQLVNAPEKLFAIIMFVFACGFMGSDLSDPVRFFNTHYIFLWLPLFFAIVGQKESLPKPPGSVVLDPACH